MDKLRVCRTVSPIKRWLTTSIWWHCSWTLVCADVKEEIKRWVTFSFLTYKDRLAATSGFILCSQVIFIGICWHAFKRFVMLLYRPSYLCFSIKSSVLTSKCIVSMYVHLSQNTISVGLHWISVNDYVGKCNANFKVKIYACRHISKIAGKTNFEASTPCNIG